jgi:hypothetical protein
MRHEVLVTDEAKRDARGRLEISAAKLSPSLKLGCALYVGTVVSEATRQKLIGAGLMGLKFVELALTGPMAAQTQEQFWELISSIALPPMPRDRVIAHEKTPDDFVHVAGFTDADFFEKEMHYSASGIRALEPFDLAVTHEIYCGPGWKETGHGERRLVASQRFRQFCIAEQIPMSWVPVRLDPDHPTPSESPSSPHTLSVPPVMPAPALPASIAPPVPSASQTQSKSVPPVIQPASFAAQDDRFLSIIKTHLNNDFRMTVCDIGAKDEQRLNAFETACGFRLPPDFRTFVLGFGAVHIEAKENVWPRPRPGDIAPFWSHQYALFIYGCSERLPDSLDIRVQTPLFRGASGTRAVPFLRVIADPDIYCFTEQGQIARWDNERKRLEGQERSFTEILAMEVERLKERKQRRQLEGSER